MIRRWLPPILLGLVLAILTYHVTLANTPRTLMAAATKRLAKGAGYNAFFHGPLATDKARAIVRPSPDLAYSSCPLDLSKGPVVVAVAPVPALYWSLSVFDARTDVAFVRNNRDVGGRAFRIAIAQPGQQVPGGIETVRVEGARAVALIRVLVDDRARFPAIDRARRVSTCTPLAQTS